MPITVPGSGGGGAITIPTSNYFTGSTLAQAQTARNTYFTNNPQLLYDGVYAVLTVTGKSPILTQWSATQGVWVDQTPIVQGPPGGNSSLPSNWTFGVVNNQLVATQDGVTVLESDKDGTTLANSVTTGVGSFHLGDIHAIGSAGENVVFKNNEKGVSWFPAWQGQSSDGSVVYPLTSRTYGSQTFIEPNGVPMSNLPSVDYNTVFVFPANYSVSSVVIVPAETSVGPLVWSASYTDTGYLVATKQIASCTAGVPLSIPLDYPLDLNQGESTSITVKKPDGSYLKVQPGATNNSQPYRKFTYRPYSSSSVWNTSNMGAGVKVDGNGNLAADPAAIDATQLLNASQLASGGYKGAINFAGDMTQFANAQKNQFWQANTAGAIGGLSFGVGDNLYCIKNVTGTPVDLSDNTTWSIKANVNAIASTTTLGQVKPDGNTISVDGSGNIKVPLATTSQVGVSKPDGTTLKTDANGVLSSTLAAATYSVVANQAAMLALPRLTNLTICTRTDNQRIYYLNANSDPTVLSNWVDGGSTSGNVQSWNGRTGAVVPVVGDYKAYIPAWAQANAYTTGEVVKYSDGQAYIANGAIAANTAWATGTSGATWQLLTPYASTTARGQIQLAGDLAGTSSAPKVANMGGAAVPASAPTAAGQYYRATGTSTSQWSVIQAADLPAASSSTQGALKVGGVTPSALGAAAAGSSVVAAAADHVHARDIANAPVWAQANAYKQGDLVLYTDNNVYIANGSIPANTAWALGSSGATWMIADGAVATTWSLSLAYQQGEMVVYSDGNVYVANAFIAANTAWSVGTSGATWRLVGGSGATPEWASVNWNEYNQSVGSSGTIWPLGTVTGNMPASSNLFTLRAGKTYKLMFTFGCSGFSVTNAYVFAQIWNNTNSAQLGPMAVVMPATGSYSEGYSGTSEVIFSPSTDVQVGIRTSSLNGSATLRYGAFTIQQIAGAGYSGGTTTAAFSGATSSTAGATGSVPAPAAGQQSLPLLGSGTFGNVTSLAAKTGLSSQVYQFASKNMLNGSYSSMNIICGGLKFSMSVSTIGSTCKLQITQDTNVSATAGLSLTILQNKAGAYSSYNPSVTTSWQDVGAAVDGNYQWHTYDINTRDTANQVNDGQRWMVQLVTNGSSNLVVTVQYWGPNYYG